MKEFINDDVHLFKLTLLWPDGHLINQMAHALIERNAELLSLREQLAELKALPPFAYAFHRDTGVMWFAKDKPMCSEFDVIPLFTAAKPVEDSEIAKFMAGVKNSMAQEVAGVIQKAALGIMFDEITPDTETIAMQYESLVKRVNRPEDKPDEPM